MIGGNAVETLIKNVIKCTLCATNEIDFRGVKRREKNASFSERGVVRKRETDLWGGQEKMEERKITAEPPAPTTLAPSTASDSE